MTQIMCDIESLSTRPGAVILSAAFVRFSDEAHMTINLSVPDQTALGMETDANTAVWWQQQSAVAWEAATSNPVPIATALPYIAQWLVWASPDADPLLWAHGASFDGPLLEELFRRAGVPCPWKFWNLRDTRTLYDLAGIDVRNYACPPPHVALNDALAQTRAANAALVVIAGLQHD